MQDMHAEPRQHRDVMPRSQRAARRSLTIQARFLLGTGAILFFFCVTSALLIFFNEKRSLENSAYAQTELVMAAVDAAREYVRYTLRPKMSETFGQDFFMMESMSTSYVGRAVMDRFQDSIPDFDYRRVSINARNPDSEANAMEKEMIAYFRRNQDADNWQGLLKTEQDAFYRRFKPVYFDQSCMRCHGDPSDAPRDLLDIYGSERGFGHYAGELAGVIAVGVPVDSALAMIKEKAASVFLAVFFGISVFFLALSFFFNRVVVHNLHGLLNIFRRELEYPDEPIGLTQDVSRDEIEELTASAALLAERLQRNKQELRNYAQNLEKLVEERTQALQDSKQLLQKKVVTRNQELQTLNTIAELTTQATGLAQMLPSALHETLELVPAMGAGIFLFEEEQTRLVLRHQVNADCLPTDIELPGGGRGDIAEQQPANLEESVILASQGRLSRFILENQRGLLNIPLGCRGVILGVMTLTGMDMQNLSSEQEELLISIGRQIGIALESLNNLHKLIQSKELLQSVFDGITDHVVLLDSVFQIKMVNKAYLRRYGTSLESVLGAQCHELQQGSHTSCRQCGLREVMRTRQPLSTETSCASGEIFLVNFYPIFDDQGEVESVIRYAREITDQKRVEQKIQHTEKLVSMGQLAAGVAHEINNPLGVILCYVDLLKRQLADYPQGRKDLAVIEKQTRNCKRIVTDLLQFSRGQDSAKTQSSVNAALQEVTQMLASQFKKNKVALELDLDPDLPALTLDVNRIKQVFVNLLLNALQATDGDPGIVIRTRYVEDSRQAEIEIMDNGHGIALDIQNKIFDPFFSTKGTGEGSGLGLSVSYGIVRDHGGEITVHSRPGEGASFIIRLPATQPGARQLHGSGKG